MKTLALFVRRDGAGYAHAISVAGEDAARHFARNLYPTPGEAFPGAKALEAWEGFVVGMVGPSCRTVRDAMAAWGIDA